MIFAHWFWLLFVLATLGWFTCVVGVVAVKGYRDIRAMLASMDKENADVDSTEDVS
jgi:hypothetical protein